MTTINKKETPCYQCITFPICKSYLHNTYTVLYQEDEDKTELEPDGVFDKSLQFYINIHQVVSKCSLIYNYLESSEEHGIISDRLECIKTLFDITCVINWNEWNVVYWGDNNGR